MADNDLYMLCRLPPNCSSNQFRDSFSRERSALQTLLVKRNLFVSFHSDAVVCVFYQRSLEKTIFKQFLQVSFDLKDNLEAMYTTRTDHSSVITASHVKELSEFCIRGASK